MEDFEPVAERIGEHDQVLDPALLRERARAAGDRHARLLQTRRKPLQRGRVGDLPAEESDPFAAVFLDDDALLAVVHAQRKLLAALLQELHAQKSRAEAAPVLERICVNADISERLNIHARSPHHA